MRRLERIGSLLTTFMLIGATGLLAADNALTNQEKTEGWILLFDGKTLNGWEPAVPPVRASGTAPAPPATYPQVGRKPRACSTAAGNASAPAGAAHWEVVKGMIEPCGEPAGNLTTTASYKDFVLNVDFRTGEDTNSGVFVRAGDHGGYEVQIWKAQPDGYNTGSIVGAGKTAGEGQIHCG